MILIDRQATLIAWRALLTLATWSLKRGTAPLSTQAIARRTDASEAHLAKILQTLRRCGHVTSVRGAHGGFRLGALPGDIRLYDVVVAFEGTPIASLVDLPAGLHEVFDQTVTEFTAALAEHTLAASLEAEGEP